MDNREKCISIAKDLLGIPQDERLSKKMQYWLVGAYNMVEKTGGILHSRQAISAIIVSVQMNENLEDRMNSRMGRLYDKCDGYEV